MFFLLILLSLSPIPLHSLLVSFPSPLTPRPFSSPGVWSKYRQGPNGNRLPYVFTNPAPETIMKRCDRVFVLSEKQPGTSTFLQVKKRRRGAEKKGRRRGAEEGGEGEGKRSGRGERRIGRERRMCRELRIALQFYLPTTMNTPVVFLRFMLQKNRY